MPKVHRHKDECTGHGCFPSRPNNQASQDVFINNKGSHRKGDSWQSHCCVVCHGGNTSKGSPNVFVNNKDMVRVGDPVDCGSNTKTGSPTVFIND